MKIALVTSTLGVGGAERQLMLLASGLEARGHDVKVISLYPIPPMGVAGDVRVAVVSLDRRGRWDFGRAVWRLDHLVRQDSPDIVHSFLLGPNLTTALIRSRFAKAKLVWGIRASRVDLRQYGKLSEISFSLAARTAHRADLIIANSEAGRRHHVTAGYPAEKMMVVPNGIDTEYFKIDPARRDRQRLAWGLRPEDGPVVGFVGRVDPVKGHRTFIEAIARLAATHRRIRAVCVGGGNPEGLEGLRRLTSNRGLDRVVIWQENAPDMPAVYNGFDVLCQSSTSEGFPNVVGEAMACGVPCVVTDVGDSARIVGTLGSTVPPGDADRMAEALAHRLGRCGSEASVACRTRIVEEFPAAKMVEQTETALLKLVGR